MSGHGKRETILRANATRWRDRVCADMATATGCAALSEHRLSIRFVNDVVDAIAGCIAAGDDLVVNHHSSRRRLVAKFLAARGHVEIVPGDLLRPIGARDGELFGGGPVQNPGNEKSGTTAQRGPRWTSRITSD